MRLFAKLLSGSQSKSARERAARVGRGTVKPSLVSADERARLIGQAGAEVEAGHYSDALQRIDGALDIAPDDAELTFARASTLFSWGRYIEACAAHRRAEQLGLTSSALHTQRGWAAYWIGKQDEALQSMRKAVAKSPDDWATHFGLAVVLRSAKSLEESLQASIKAVELNPDDFYCLAGLISCEVESGRLQDAEIHARRAVELHPENPLAWSNLGGVLDHQTRFDEALDAYRRAEALELQSPQAPDEYFNCVICLMRAARTHEALALLESHLPACTDARAQSHYALALLTAGRMIEGWDQYEFRWMKEPLSLARAPFVKPVWTGQDLRGRTILLRSEQGHGDFIQFIRYARHVKALGATVLLQLRKEVRSLAERLPEIDRILEDGEPYPDFDFYANLMSLPRAFGTDLTSMPARVPYLSADPDRAERWEQRIPRDGALNVGLVWAGSPTHPRDRFRSLALAQLAPLASIQGVRFYSLQKGPAAGEATAPPDGMRLVDVGRDLETFGDTAAVMVHLDLVIAIDTSVVHLAGALGRPVWVLLPKPADFRWLEDRDDSPWYPTMRLFRQREIGQWDDVISAVRQALSDQVAIAAAELGGSAPRVETFALDIVRPAARQVHRAVRGLSEVAETRMGIMQYFPDQPVVGASIRRYGECRHGEMEVMRRIGVAGQTILEAGAGVGYHALFLAAAAGSTGHLFLYEDDELYRRALRQNLASNRVTNATLMRRSLCGSQVAPPVEGDAAPAGDRSSPPTSETIDELCLQRLDWIKVDERVSATDILDGAVNTIWRLRPKLFIGVPDEQMIDALAARAQALGYSTWRVVTPLFAAANFNLCDEDVFDGRRAFALVAIPEEAGIELALEECERIASGEHAIRRDRESMRGDSRRPAPDRTTIASAARELAAAGRYGEALAHVDEGLQRFPADKELLFARGRTLFDWGRVREARTWLVKAAERGLVNSTLFLQLGWTWLWTAGGRASEPWMRKAVAAEPSGWLPNFGLASALQGQGKLDEAVASFERAVELAPDNVHALLHLAECKLGQKQPGAAESIARRAIALDAKNARPWITLGIALISIDRFEEATEAFQHAYGLAEHSGADIDTHLNLGICLRESGRIDEALALYERRLPNLPSVAANAHYAHALFLAGRLREGFTQYEFRWMQQPLLGRRPSFRKPVWDGQDLRGKTILLRTEQGVGDVIQFIRYAPHVKALGATVLLQVRPGVGQLARAFPGVDTVLDPDQPYPHFDYCIHLMSLPRVFGTELASIPAAVPYLQADAGRRSQWADRIGRDARFKVGLVWAGDPEHLRDRYRSVALSSLAPLARVEGVQYYSLQKGAARSQLENPPSGMRIDDLAPELHDFADTAAVMEQLDLTICVDTSVAHLAGALGKAVWLLVPDPPEWRWMTRRDDSPWYPTMRLFRQQRQNDWSGVFDRLGDALCEAVRSRVGRGPADMSTDRPPTGNQPMMPIQPPRHALPGLTGVVETVAGIVQYVPDGSAESRSIEWYGEYRIAELRLLAPMLKPGASIMEINPGIGIQTLTIASIVGNEGHVILYEPRRRLQPLLRQNLSANGIGHFTVMKRRLVGTSEQASGDDVSLRTAGVGSTSSDNVTETIDDLRLEALDWLKLGEWTDAIAVLDGAAETLWRLRPSLFIAIADEPSAHRIATRARDFGYQCWKIETPLFNADNFNLRETDIFDGRVAMSIVAIPEERESDAALDGCSKITD